MPPTPSYQPLPLLLAAALFGILLDRWIALSAPLWGTLALAAFVLWIGAWCHTKRYAKHFALTSFLLLAVCFAVFGLRHHVFWNHFSSVDIGHFAKIDPQPAVLRGTVIEMPRYFPQPPPDPGRSFQPIERTMFTLHATALRDRADWIPVTGRVAVTLEGDQRNWHIGDNVQLIGQLSLPFPPRNPGDFDYPASLRNRRILCLFRASSVNMESGQPEFPAAMLKTKRLLEHLRRAGHANLEKSLSPETAAKASAMILGIREAVDDETIQSLQETGTYHILAISGLHIGLVAATVGFLLRFFGVSRRKTALVLIATVLVYLFLTDVRPPAIRATVLVCVVALGMFAGRPSFGMNALCGTALIVLVLNPSDLFQFGPQLSFLATGAFFWVPNAEKCWHQFRQLFEKHSQDGQSQSTDAEESQLKAVERYEPSRWPAFLLCCHLLLGIFQLVLVSLVLWLVTMPLILDRIHLFTPVALAINPLLWLPMTAALLAGFATMIFGSVPFFGEIFATLADKAFGFLFGMIDFFHDFGAFGAYLWMPGPPKWWILIFYAAFVILTFFPLRRPPAKILAIILLGWCVIGFSSGYIRDWNRLHDDRLTLSILSVGHGNCVLITTPQGKTIIYDVGCLSAPGVACDVMSRALWRQGKRHVDAVLISHPDKDHYNGLIGLTERFSIGAVLVSPDMQKILNEPQFEEKSLLQLHDTLKKRKIPLISVADGDSLARFGLSNSLILHPPNPKNDEEKATFVSLSDQRRRSILGHIFRGKKCAVAGRLGWPTCRSFFGTRKNADKNRHGSASRWEFQSGGTIFSVDDPEYLAHQCRSIHAS